MKKRELVVKKWYEALANGKILAYRCKRCGSFEYPPVYVCNECSGVDMDWIEISGNAKLLSFYMPGPMGQKPENQHLKPYVFGCVQLDEGPSLNTIITGISPEDSAELKGKLPLQVKATIDPRDGFDTVVFRLVK